MIQRTEQERVIWKAFPSWRHFSWLYLFIILTAGRALLFFRFGLPGWEMWIGGALVLLLITVVIRHWACYILTSKNMVINNGYTRREIGSMKLEVVKRIDCLQGPVDKLLGIGTVLLQSSNDEQELRLRGVKDPHVAEAKIRALLPMTLSDT